MPTHSRARAAGTSRLGASLLCALLVAGAAPARADDVGFQLNRYEPTVAGESFFSVAHPWYSSTRYFAAGLTLDYNHNPLVYRLSQDGDPTAIVAHQLVGHLDIGASFLDRFQLSLTLPVTLAEGGNDPMIPGAADLKPSGAVIGDPRLGAMIRLFGQPRTGGFSMHLGGFLWIPVKSNAQHAGDAGVRFLPRLVASGIADWLRWSASLGVLLRGKASLGAAGTQIDGGNGVGHQLQIGAALGYTDAARRLTLGPEATFSTLLVGNPFSRNDSSLELLLGFNYLIADVFQVGAAVGGGVWREVGTPDARILLRLGYAPLPARDSDGDGFADDADACPKEPGVASEDPKRQGCPVHDRDKDGMLDEDDLCPDEPRGQHPDPKRPGCPAKDSDGDTLYDYEDQCPLVPMGAQPDINRLGCPLNDRDSDGVLDADDACPAEPAGEHPDPARKGCPAGDRDGDAVIDPLDVCPDQAAGLHPDPEPARKGCPSPDRDGDNVIDPVDACPDQAGAASPDPIKNGCPSLAVVKNGMIVLLQPVFFATDKDIILPKSFPLLGVVQGVMVAQPELRKVEIQGHTDSRGKYAHNMDLSDRRARAVMKWLVNHGIAAERLSAKGYGPNKPVASNKTDKGRSINRRVEFHIVSAGPGGVPVQVVAPGASAPAPAAAPGTTTVAAPPSSPELDGAPTAAPAKGMGKAARGKAGKGKGKGKAKGKGKGKAKGKRRR